MAAARSFRTENIRNVAVLGHGGSGKTTLIDAVCFASGTSRRKGNVNAGTALTMTTPEETGHGMSMQLTVAHAVRNGDQGQPPGHARVHGLRGRRHGGRAGR